MIVVEMKANGSEHLTLPQAHCAGTNQSKYKAAKLVLIPQHVLLVYLE